MLSSIDLHVNCTHLLDAIGVDTTSALSYYDSVPLIYASFKITRAHAYQRFPKEGTIDFLFVRLFLFYYQFIQTVSQNLIVTNVN